MSVIRRRAAGRAVGASRCTKMRPPSPSICKHRCRALPRPPARHYQSTPSAHAAPPRLPSSRRCLSPQDGFEGGGTYFPAASGDVDGILLRPTPGYCLIHDGNIKHAGNEVISGDRYILVGFYNADGRDRAGEEMHFNQKALEEARAQLLRCPPVPTQTIYFTTAVAAGRGGPSSLPLSSTQESLLPQMGPFLEDGVAGGSMSGGGSRNLSSVAIQGPILPIPGPSIASAHQRDGERGACPSDAKLGRFDVLPTPPTSLPPIRPGSPTDSVSGPLTLGTSGSVDGGHASSSEDGSSSVSGQRRNETLSERPRSHSPHPNETASGSGTLHSLSGGRGCSTSCIPSWPVLNMLLHSKLRPTSKLGR